MATLKAQKLKEDAHRKVLEDGILEILSLQRRILELLEAMAIANAPTQKPTGGKHERSAKQTTKQVPRNRRR